MCGIAAFYAYHYAAPEIDAEELRGVREAMAPRGPDGCGEWMSPDGRAGLAHRRLSIIDLTDRAAQPMANEDSSVVLSFNGEIYNYRELREGLAGRGARFRSDSDTEVLLRLYLEKGEKMFSDLRGMFALAVWDGPRRRLLLARDPYGIKPLYYADDGWSVRAASQVRALLACGKVSRAPEPAGHAGFFLLGSVPEPFTLYQDIRQVPAGSYVTFSETGARAPVSYFSVASVFAGGRSPAGDENAAESARAAFADSVRAHLVADVEVGLFLSAGVDSGALLGLAAEAGPRAPRAVTLAFEEYRGTASDESPLAARTAAAYGAEHLVRTLAFEEFSSEMTRFLAAMDQPTIDGVNTYFVSRAAREAGLKVALSGVGADELLGGYPSFREVPRAVSWAGPAARVPFVGAVSAAALRRLLPAGREKWAGLLRYAGSYAGAYYLKRGLFLPWELPALLGEEASREGLRRLCVVRHLRAALSPEPGSAFGRVAALESSC
ncbi:MAG TPA: asparagine synthase (glutamine-hydrolyzing), partial [Candidatus Eisenbacteria bacterium]|nr:asparagine synthase (glutamine-hydrolyzing) [Candidatus Eisenbacteria bacterium]